MVTSSAVVGSSAISSRGPQASAIAIITRWRMPPESWCGYWPTRRSGSGMLHRRSISIARCERRGARQAAVQHQRFGDLVADGEHRVERGHRLLEDHRDRGCRASRASRRSVSASRSRALEQRCARRRCARAASAIRRRIESAVTLLPQPDSPTTPSVSPRLDGERHAVDGPHHAVARVEMRLQVVDLSSGRTLGIASHLRARRGSSASRMPSPSRLTASTVSGEADARETRSGSPRSGTGCAPRP